MFSQALCSGAPSEYSDSAQEPLQGYILKDFPSSLQQMNPLFASFFLQFFSVIFSRYFGCWRAQPEALNSRNLENKQFCTVLYNLTTIKKY